MSLGGEMLDEIRETTRRIALELGVIGLINIQYAVAGGELYVIEANPRASRTVPFVSQGDRRAARQARLPADARRAAVGDLELPSMHNGHVSRQGGGAAVRPLRRRRHGARAGDEVHRRGDGDRPRLPDRVRQGPGGRRGRAAGVGARSSSRVTDTDKAAATQLAARFHDLGFEVDRHRGDRAGDLADGDPGADDQQDRRRLAARRRLHPRRARWTW